MDRKEKPALRSINLANYWGGLFPPKTGQMDRMLWALNNIDALQREADELGLEVNAWCLIRTETLLAQLAPEFDSGEDSSAGDLMRDGEGVAKGFAEAEANFRLSGLDPSADALYQKLKSERIEGAITAEEMSRALMEHYRVQQTKR